MSKASQKHKKIFVSHTHADKSLADAIVQSLAETLNIRQEEKFFYSSDGRLSITSGSNIVDEVVNSLKNDTDCVLALLTSNSHNKPWLHFEAGGAFVKSKLVSILLPGCPADDKLPLFFTWGLYHDLRTISEKPLEDLYETVSGFFNQNQNVLPEKKKEFSIKFFEKSRNLFPEQVAAVCIRQEKKSADPKILLIKNKDTDATGKEVSGTRRHFPKYDMWFANRAAPADAIAVVSASMEAGIAVAPIGILDTFLHFKEKENKEKRVLAYSVEFFDEPSDFNTANAILREPKWFTQSQALKEVAKNRGKKYKEEYQRVIKQAFAEWLRKGKR